MAIKRNPLKTSFEANYFFHFLLICNRWFCTVAQVQVINRFHINSTGWWDYIAVNNGRVYVSHGNQLNILDAETGDSLDYIPNTNGVHGVAFDLANSKGYTSNGNSNSVTVFDLKTNKVLATIDGVEKNPDAITFESFTKTIITCNGGSNNLSVIDLSKIR